MESKYNLGSQVIVVDSILSKIKDIKLGLRNKGTASTGCEDKQIFQTITETIKELSNQTNKQEQ